MISPSPAEGLAGVPLPAFRDLEDPAKLQPEEGSMDWEWFKPSGTGKTTSTGVPTVTTTTASSMDCLHCGTRGVKDPWAAKMQCWNCGRFMKMPTPYAYTPSPSAYSGWRG